MSVGVGAGLAEGGRHVRRTTGFPRGWRSLGRAMPLSGGRAGRRVKCDSRHSSATGGRRWFRLTWPLPPGRSGAHSANQGQPCTSDPSLAWSTSLLSRVRSTTAFRQPNPAGKGALTTHRSHLSTFPEAAVRACRRISGAACEAPDARVNANPALSGSFTAHPVPRRTKPPGHCFA